MAASLSLPPLQDSIARIFVKAQFRTKPRAPPEALSLKGQTAVVTGGNTGLGLEAIEQMLSHGISRLVMGVRTVSKGEEAAVTLRRKYGDAQVDVWELNMMSYESVQAFAEKCATLPRLDKVILSAATNRPDFVLSPHGHEETFQVNYLSTALLAILMLPPLRASSEKHGSGPGRLTIVSSNMALTAKFANRDNVPLIPSFDDGAGWSTPKAEERYADTKLLVLMLVQKLAELVPADSITVNAVDPGLVAGTGMLKTFPLPRRIVHGIVKALAARTLQQGAWTYLDAVAVKGQETHGGLLMNWELCSFHPMMHAAEGKKTTEQLWSETIEEFKFARAEDILASMPRRA